MTTKQELRIKKQSKKIIKKIITDDIKEFIKDLYNKNLLFIKYYDQKKRYNWSPRVFIYDRDEKTGVLFKNQDPDFAIHNYIHNNLKNLDNTYELFYDIFKNDLFNTYLDFADFINNYTIYKINKLNKKKNKHLRAIKSMAQLYADRKYHEKFINLTFY